MQAANDLHVHPGCEVKAGNAPVAPLNLIDSFWMLPLFGVHSLKTRDIVGFSFLQRPEHAPVMLFMPWRFAGTLTLVPPVTP